MWIKTICSTPEGYRASYTTPTGPMYKDIVCWATIERNAPNPHGEPLREYVTEIHGMVFPDAGGRLVEKHGYDTKNAAHLIRLLQMGIEFLTEGRLYVERKNASELLAIKDGAYTLEQVQEKAEGLFTLAEEVYVASSLPLTPENDLIEALCVNCLRDSVRIHSYSDLDRKKEFEGLL